jgi:hypothetical protein
MRPDEQVPNKDDKRVLSFCRSLVPDSQPFYVSVQPELGFWPLQCLPNVAKKVEMSGGEGVRGWEISQLPKVYLEARFHAVWRSPTGKYVDVTPEESGQQRILFLPDARHSSSEPPVQQHRFLLARDAAAVGQYLKIADELIGLMHSHAWGAIQTSDPAIRNHILNLQAESRRIRERIQNDT